MDVIALFIALVAGISVLLPIPAFPIGRRITAIHHGARRRFNRFALFILPTYYVLLLPILLVGYVVDRTGVEVPEVLHLEDAILALVFGGTAVAIVLVSKARSLARSEYPTECWYCGYVLDPAIQSRCPECGKAVPSVTQAVQHTRHVGEVVGTGAGAMHQRRTVRSPAGHHRGVAVASRMSRVAATAAWISALAVGLALVAVYLCWAFFSDW